MSSDRKKHKWLITWRMTVRHPQIIKIHLPSLPTHGQLSETPCIVWHHPYDFEILPELHSYLISSSQYYLCGINQQKRKKNEEKCILELSYWIYKKKKLEMIAGLLEIKLNLKMSLLCVRRIHTFSSHIKLCVIVIDSEIALKLLHRQIYMADI